MEGLKKNWPIIMAIIFALYITVSPWAWEMDAVAKGLVVVAGFAFFLGLDHYVFRSNKGESEE